jgi:hypothetical protein
MGGEYTDGALAALRNLPMRAGDPDRQARAQVLSSQLAVPGPVV